MAEGHGPVVGLEQQWSRGVLGVSPGVAGRMGGFHVVVNQRPLRTTFSKRALAIFFPSLSNRGARKTISSVCHWPGALAAFKRGRDAFIKVVILQRPELQLGPGVDAAAVVARRMGHLPSVDNLDLVHAVQLDPGVRVAGDQEIQRDFKVAPFLRA